LPVAAALVVVFIAPGRGWADERAERGISVSAWAAEAVDRSVTIAGHGDERTSTTPVFGLTGLGNVGPLALGAAIDGTPAVDRDGRLVLSTLFGYQPRIGGSRVHLLGEVGGHMFSNVGAERAERQFGPDRWLPFLGLRLGAARTMADHGRFELGLWLFCRYDVGQATVSTVGGPYGDDTRTEYRVGGFMTGVAFQMGVRFERLRAQVDSGR
jgi:hypothetical protein